MLAYTIRRLAYNVPVFLTIILLVMLALRVNDPVYSFLGKNAKPEDVLAKREQIGLDKPFQFAAAGARNTFNRNYRQRVDLVAGANKQTLCNC